MRAAIAFSLLTSCLALPYFNKYPSFYDESTTNEKPTVNVFKIYAPKLFYMPGYDSSKSNAKRDKTIYSAANDNMINEIVDTAMFPDKMFDQDSDSFFDYHDDDFVPEASSVVSRKMPAYAPFEPSMHLDRAAAEDRMDYWDDEAAGFYNKQDYDDSHSRVYSHIVSDDVPVPAYHAGQFFEPLVINAPAPVVREDYSPVAQEQQDVSPLTQFFERMAGQSSKTDKAESQYQTTVTFGEPELVEEDTAMISDQIKAFNEENSADQDEESLELSSEETSDETLPEVEIERNFVKTILPDNTSVTQEVKFKTSLPTKQEEELRQTETSEDVKLMSVGKKGETQEVEVNIVKTVLPDDSYLIGQAGGADERLQDDLISMIQQAESSPASADMPFRRGRVLRRFAF